ncbi:MAG: transglycosylase, partial [Gammaproteobacteria bacterium HGW-Gammaproteobacteria-10]
MAKPATTRKRGGVKPGPKLKSQAHIRRPSRPPGQFKRNVWLTLLEVFGLLVVVTLAIIVLLGYSSIWFSGTRLLTSLLPFAAGILGLVVLSAGFLVLWWKLSRFCRDRMAVLPALLSVSLAVLTAWTVTRGEFALAYSHFRTLVGG